VSGFRRSSLVVNWGSTLPLTAVNAVNNPQAVALAVDKLDTFNMLLKSGVSIPEFVTQPPEGREGIWLARTRLRASGGEGIVVLRKDDEVVPAPLYVKYVPKLLEYRVHVFNQPGGSETYVQQKLRRNGVEQDRDQALLRNHENGWVFAQPTTAPPSSVITEATAAVEYLGLDFGAVDIIVGRDDGKAYVLEVNTAPGLQGETTLKFYAEAIDKLTRA
jgi:glutathione synthase/RimK-type ligase-like ATP-grasp enzyme